MGKCDKVDNAVAQTADTTKNIDSDCALEILKNGNDRFKNNVALNRNLIQEVKDTAGGQYPFAAILSCLDSRVSAELIFDQGIGDLLNFRSAGNFVDAAVEENNNILGSLEFANASGVKLILVLGHTGCGAIDAAIGVPDPEWCHPMARMVKRLKSNLTTDDNLAATRENVNKTIDNIRNQSACLRSSEYAGRIQIRGGIYSIATGNVEFFDYKRPVKEAT